MAAAPTAFVDRQQAFQHQIGMPVSTVPSRDPPKTYAVYDALRQRIRDLALAPGAPLLKDDIALEFGVSRAPVGHAITRLAEEGLVDIYPQHGSFVAKIRAEDVREGLFIRTALEVEVVRRVAAIVDDEALKLLEDNLALQEEALRRGNLRRLYELDEAMHDNLFSIAGYNRAHRYVDAARAALDRMRKLALPKGDRAQWTIREHRWIVDSIGSKDPSFADAAMRRHLAAVAESVEAQLLTLKDQVA